MKIGYVTFTLILGCFALGLCAQEVTPPVEPQSVVEILQNALYFNRDHRSLDDKIRTMAVAETAMLGRNQAGWSPRHEKWALVYWRVLSDLERHAPEIAAAWDQDKAQEAYQQAILSQLSVEDVTELHQFASSELGARYARFMLGLDRALHSSSYTFDADGHAKAHCNASMDLCKQYMRIAHLSRQYKSLVAIHLDPGATALERARYAASDLILESTFDGGASQLNQLLATFQNDLPAFEAYERSDLAQHIFKAMAITDRDLSKFVVYWGAAEVERIKQPLRPRWIAYFAATVK
ncbi:hypothetical protein [Rhodanobacter sp. C06]|uniref:hypothetical protein n=1 Tax=Rhodanobacter sp. C06 TaxID=1945854 RepID=UPI00111558CD|nr:hypothetical protein [Rhodanobacter sp. C06]